MTEIGKRRAAAYDVRYAIKDAPQAHTAGAQFTRLP